MNDPLPTPPSGLIQPTMGTGEGRIEVHPGKRPNELTVYLRKANGVLHRLPKKDVDQILRDMTARMNEYKAKLERENRDRDIGPASDEAGDPA